MTPMKPMAMAAQRCQPTFSPSSGMANRAAKMGTDMVMAMPQASAIL